MIEEQNITFNQQDVWDKTFNDSAEYQSFGNGTFSFAHLRSGNSWDGTSWEGFTISRSTDTLLSHLSFYPDHQWGIMSLRESTSPRTPENAQFSTRRNPMEDTVGRVF